MSEDSASEEPNIAGGFRQNIQALLFWISAYTTYVLYVLHAKHS
jgi:hypothetical protein